MKGRDPWAFFVSGGMVFYVDGKAGIVNGIPNRKGCALTYLVRAPEQNGARRARAITNGGRVEGGSGVIPGRRPKKSKEKGARPDSTNPRAGPLLEEETGPGHHGTPKKKLTHGRSRTSVFLADKTEKQVSAQLTMLGILFQSRGSGHSPSSSFSAFSVARRLGPEHWGPQSRAREGERVKDELILGVEKQGGGGKKHIAPGPRPWEKKNKKKNCPVGCYRLPLPTNFVPTVSKLMVWDGVPVGVEVTSRPEC